MTTKKPVKKRPRSRTAAPELSTKSSGLAQRLQIQLGTGAITYVATTSSGKYEWKRAQERMTRRKPSARTKERAMMVLRPAVGMVGDFARGGCGFFLSYSMLCRRILESGVSCRFGALPSACGKAKLLVDGRRLLRFRAGAADGFVGRAAAASICCAHEIVVEDIPSLSV